MYSVSYIWQAFILNMNVSFNYGDCAYRMDQDLWKFEKIGFIQNLWSSTKYIYKIASYSTYGFYSKFLEKFFIQS